jgi:hypothetical protein
MKPITTLLWKRPEDHFNVECALETLRYTRKLCVPAGKLSDREDLEMNYALAKTKKKTGRIPRKCGSGQSKARHFDSGLCRGGRECPNPNP